MKIIVLFFLTLNFSCIYELGAQSLIFEKAFPGQGVDVGRCVIEAPDSSLIIISSTTINTNGLADIVVTKMTPSGSQVWSTMNGGFNNDIANAGIVLSDGSTVAVGFTGSFTSSPSRDLYLIKVDPQGNIVWTKSYGGSSTDEGMDIKQTADGGFIIAGFTESYGAGGEDFWLIKTDSLGNMMWDTTFGGTGIDNARGIGITADSGYIITGAFSGAGGGDQSLWLVKTDSTGAEEWNQSFGMSGNMDWGWDVAVASDGYVAAGTRNYNESTSAQFTGSTFFIKVDLQGNLLWDQSITTSIGSQLISLYPGSQGGWVLGGTRWTSGFQSDFWILKTDSMGQLVWELALGDASRANMAVDVIQTMNGDIVATGYSGLSPSTTENLHLVRISDNSIGIKEQFSVSEKGLISVSPNPSRGMLTIQLSSEGLAGTLSVSNGLGKQVLDLELKGESRVELDLSHLPAGMYFLNLRSMNVHEVARVIVH